MSDQPLSFREIVRLSVFPLSLAFFAGILCWLAAETSLGLYLGGVAMVTILLPPLVAGCPSIFRAMMVGGCVVDGIAIVWLIGLFDRVSFVQWLMCYIVLIAYAAALFGLVVALRRFIGTIASATITLVVALTWLTWPIWLATQLRGPQGATIAFWLVPAHPLFAVNSILRHLGIWLEHGLIYRHVTLGQDVAYRLPETPWPSVIVHLLVGVALVALSRIPLRHPPASATMQT